MHRDLAMWLNGRNECRRWRHCANYSARALKKWVSPIIHLVSSSTSPSSLSLSSSLTTFGLRLDRILVSTATTFLGSIRASVPGPEELKTNPFTVKPLLYGYPFKQWPALALYRQKLCFNRLIVYVHTWRLRLRQRRSLTLHQWKRKNKHRMGLNPFLTFYIDAMLNVDANANVKSEHTISVHLHWTLERR